MKQKLLWVCLLIFSLKAFSQDSNLSVEFNYPLTIDNNIIGRNSNGILDAGLKYRFVDLGLVNLGLGINTGFYINNKEDRVQPFDVETYIFSPKLFGELNIPAVKRLKPSIGLGYSFLLFRADVEDYNRQSNSLIAAKETLDGANLNVGILYEFSNRLFIQVQYDFIRIRLEEGIPDFKYNTNVNILKAGLGIRL